MPSRSEGRGGLFKARAQRALYRYPRSAPIRTRSASRKFIWNALRANFEQTAPPSLREGSPPDSGGDSPIYTSCRKIVKKTKTYSLVTQECDGVERVDARTAAMSHSRR